MSDDNLLRSVCASCCVVLMDIDPDMGDGISWEQGECNNCGKDGTVFDLLGD